MLTNLFRTTAVASIVLGVFIAPVRAGETNTLLGLKEKCISATALNQARCGSYIEGVIGGYFAAVSTLEKHDIRLAFFCAPKPEARDMKSSEAYVRKYMNSHPGDDQRDPKAVIFEALREAYGCKD